MAKKKVHTPLAFGFQGQGVLQRTETFITQNSKTILTLIVLVEVGDNYPQIIPCKVFGRLVDECTNIPAGSLVSISGRVGGREWKDRVYADIVADSVTLLERNWEPPNQGSDYDGDIPDEEPPY